MKLKHRLNSVLAILLAITFVIPTSYMNVTHSTELNSGYENSNDTEVNNGNTVLTDVLNSNFKGTATLLNNSDSDIVYELTDTMLPTDSDNTEEEASKVVETKVTDLDVSNLTKEELDNALKFSSMNEIGEWLYNLSEEEFNKVLEFDTILNKETLIVNIDEEITSDNETLVYWEACQYMWFNSQISLMSWTDQFYGGNKGNARFYMHIKCDGEVIRTYTIDVPNVTQPDDMTIEDMSLGLITCTSNKGACSRGHSVDINFKKIQKVTSSQNYWSGIRIYGSYVRPAGYGTTDYATNDMLSGTGGFGAAGYSRFGTVTYGELEFANPYVLDARYYNEEITDQFIFEGNSFQTGLMDGHPNYHVKNFGASHYYICLDPSSKTYTINPNGGYYEGSKSNKSYTKYLASDALTVIKDPVWQSETEGKSFTGWKLSGMVYTQEGTTPVEVTSNILKTNGQVTLWHCGGKDGRYQYPDTYGHLYTSSIYYEEAGDATLTAQWKIDWIKVNFDGNKPVEENEHAVEGVTPDNKQVWVGKTYGELPTPTLYGYKFLGWYTDPVGGYQVTADTICNVTITHTLYAHWQDVRFKVSFDTNKPVGMESTTVSGMTGYENGKDIFVGQAYGYLPDKGNNNWPTPALSNLTFTGWYTSPVGGTKITAGTKVTIQGNHTLYARWDQELVLDTTVKLDYSSYTDDRTYYRGGVYLDWSDYYKTGGYYNAYRKLSTSNTWTQITPGPPNNSATDTKLRDKFWKDTGANDKAKPNTIAESTVTASHVGSNTRVTFKAPTDRGTTYNFYVKETTFTSLGVKGTYSYNSSAPAQAYTFIAPTKGNYRLIAIGAGTPKISAQYVNFPAKAGGYTTGDINLDNGDSIYCIVGGSPSGRTGGTNGGGSGGDGGRDGYGGAGATHFSTYNRGYLANHMTYNSSGGVTANYSSEILLVSAGAGGGGGNGDDGEGWSLGQAAGGAGGTLNTNGNGGNGSRGNSHQGGDYSKLAGYGGKGGTQTAGGAGGNHGGAHGLDDGHDRDYRSGAGGGGGAGYYGGGGGGGGSQAYWGIHYGADGGGGKFGKGGNGGNAAYTGSYPGFHSGAGGGGGAGSSYMNTSKLTNASYKVASNGGSHGSASVELLKDLSDVTLKKSNTTTETVTSGILGYRYIIDKSSSTSITGNTASFTSSTVINVANKSYAQYLHIAPQDKAGNIGATIHVYIKPTYTITYELNGGTCNPANPGGYTEDTLPLTLINPTQEGYTFIGWTGSNGSTPQMEVTIPVGSTGNKHYVAHWAGNTPYVSDFTLVGDVYKYATRFYYIRKDYVFDLKMYSYVKDKDGNIVDTVVYTPTNNYINVKDRTEEYIQTRDSELPMTEFKGYLGRWTYQEGTELKILDYTLNTRSSTAYGSTNSYKYMNTVVKATLTEHLAKVFLFPQAGVNTGTVINKSEQFPEDKKLTIVADGKAPIITDNIIDDGLYDEKIFPITVNIKDEDSGESGIKQLKVDLENLDTGYKETLTNINNTSYVTSTSFTYKNSSGGEGLILKDNENYVGKIKVTITAVDNVNNTSKVEKIVYVISLDTAIKRMLPIIDIDGNPIPDHVFKDGEQGELVIDTTGFIDQLDIEFDEPIEKLAGEQGYEFSSEVIIPLPNNGDDKNIYTKTSPFTDPDTLKPYRTDEYFFTVPLGTWVPNTDTPEDNVHYIIIKAHKEHKVLTNILVMGGTGEDGKDPVTDDYLDIEGRLETELRTRIRDASNNNK